MTKIFIKNEESCVGCRLCMLACSFRREKSYQLSRSHIKISLDEKQCSSKVFIDEKSCDNCGLCLQNCPAGVLDKDTSDVLSK